MVRGGQVIYPLFMTTLPLNYQALMVGDCNFSWISVPIISPASKIGAGIFIPNTLHTIYPYLLCTYIAPAFALYTLHAFLQLQIKSGYGILILVYWVNGDARK